MAGTGNAYDFATLEASGVADVALSPDQSLLYAAMRNGDINVYNLVTRQKVATWDVGTQLGGISVSTDGSFLLVTERQSGANVATFYRVNTATGAATAVSTTGEAFGDVEIVDADTAILTGGSTQHLYNLDTGQFAGSPPFFFPGASTLFVEDKHLTLLAYPGSSDGPLAVFDDRTNTIVAQGNNYQSISVTNSGSYTGFNWGSQAISEAAGLILQFVYYGAVNVYDIHLNYIKPVWLGERMDGLVFDPSGKYVYAYLIDSGVVAKYDVATWTRVDQFSVGTSDWHNDIGHGSQLLINSDGTRLTIVDSDKDIGKLRIVDLTIRNERFEGTAGADALDGGKGDDVYVVNHAGDAVTELAHEGEDTVETSLAFYTLGAHLEDLTGTSESGQSLTGNAAANAITGGPGDDFLQGGAGDDVIHGMGGNDFLRGEDGADQLFGDDGNDNLRGGRGVDSFDGGANDDLINPVSTYGDRVSFFEQSATQGAVADLRTGTITNDGFGNSETMTGIESLGGDTAFADTFYGNDSSNALLGSLGDFLYGFGGEDVIYLNSAPALADGGADDDVLVVVAAGPWYLPDANGDGLAELAAAMPFGWFVDLRFGYIEDGYGNPGSIQGFEAVIGSDLGDVLYGGAGDDTLVGGGGNDLMRGHAGVDHYDGGDDDGRDPLFTGYGDRVSFFDPRATQAVVADLRTGIVSNDGYGNIETMVNIESLGADTAFADTLYGNDSGNSLLGGLGDSLYGFGGDDFIQLTAAAAVVDGGAGTDQLELTTFQGYRPDSNGDGVAEVAPAMTSGWTVDLAAGTVRDGYGNVGTVTGIEDLLGTELRDELRGSAGANEVIGAGGNDLLLLQDGGDDVALGAAGNDLLYFGAAFTGADIANGGDGRDVVVLQGNYALTLSSTNLAGMESLSLQSGARTTWGDTANNFYDYDITMADANVPAGVQLIVNAQSLRVGEDFTFDGSAEMDGRFLVYGGHGVDTLKGGAGADAFFFEGGRFQAGDTVDGGGGRDSIIISSGSGVNRFEFSDTSFTNIESISVNNRFTSDPTQKPSYELILANGNVAAGATLILNGSSITDPTQTVTFDGSAVEDGNLILFSGSGGDTLIGGGGADLLYAGGSRDHLTGGAGADNFQYRAVGDSLPWGESDVIHDFEGGIDKIDLHFIDADITTPGDQAFTVIGSAQFSGQAGELRIVDMGQNMWLIMADVDGDANADFTSQADFMLAITRTDSTPMIGSDFIL